MFKLIPISACLLFIFGNTYAQNGTVIDNTTTPGTMTTPSSNGSPLTGTTTTNGVTVTPTTDMSTSTTVPAPTTVSTPPTTTDVTGTATTTTTGGTSSSTTIVTPPTGFICSGSTPQWNLTIGKDLITYSSANSPSLKIKSVTPLMPTGDSSGTLQAYSSKTDAGKPITILVKKNSTGCLNTAGQSFQYDAFVVLSNGVVTGCCNPQ